MTIQESAAEAEPTPVKQINAAARWFFRIAEWLLIVGAFQFVADKVGGDTLNGVVLQAVAAMGGFFITVAIGWPLVEIVGARIERHVERLPTWAMLILTALFLTVLIAASLGVSEFVKAIIKQLVAYGGG